MPPTARLVPRLIQRVPIWTVYIVGLLPASLYFYWGITDQLGADPQKTLERTLGLWALRFLIVTLSVTPLREMVGLNLLRYRRALGLLAFYYAVLHLITYVALDQGFDWSTIWTDIIKRPYITIGAVSVMILIPLAGTSNNASIRRLGARAWARLHKLVYLATAAAALHFVLLVKSWPLEPLVYAAIVAILLAYRLVRSIAKSRPSRTSRLTRRAPHCELT